MGSVPAAGERYAIRPSRRSTAGAALAGTLALVVAAALVSSGLGLVDLARWVAEQQRAFHAIVAALIGPGRGPLAFAGLLAACALYGFVHAVAPGHGKVMVVGVGLAGDLSALRLTLLSLAGSFAQALTAIALVYGGLALLDATTGWTADVAGGLLTPFSSLAVLAVGLMLVRRGMVGLRRRAGPARGGPCRHRHVLPPEAAKAVHGARDALKLVAAIGLRPCTGAIVVLVVAWRMDVPVAGAVGAAAMAAGTGALTGLVAASATTARGAALFADGVQHAGVAVPVAQLAGGLAIVLVSVALLVAGLVPV